MKVTGTALIVELFGKVTVGFGEENEGGGHLEGDCSSLDDDLDERGVGDERSEQLQEVTGKWVH